MRELQVISSFLHDTLHRSGQDSSLGQKCFMVSPILLVGPMASGKTSLCKKLYAAMKAEGINPFALVEENLRNEAGYPIELWYSELGTGKRRFLGRRADAFPALSPFVFDPAAFAWADGRIHKAVEEGCGALILDELGPLELQRNGGIMPSLEWALTTASCPIVLTLRPDLEAFVVPRLPVPMTRTPLLFQLSPNPREIEGFSIVQRIIRHCQKEK